MRGFLRGLLFFLAFSIPIAPSSAQDSTSTAIDGIDLPNIDVEAVRVGTLTSENAPLAVTTLSRSQASRHLEPGLSLDEILSGLPGLFVSDRGNATLGERVSIRGMGWRSAFGVRGVQILIDGIPLTMPDGQAISDIISPSMVQRAELIRGPSSFFWGNGSGGVLYLSSASVNLPDGVRLRAMGGSYGLQQLNAEASIQTGNNRHQLYISDDRRDGYRDYSKTRFTRAAFNSKFPINQNSVVTLTSAFAFQDAQNPGSLTQDQLADSPKLANSFNKFKQAGKESLQFQGGVTFINQSQLGEFSATAYGLNRNLDNPLSFKQIDLHRAAYGTRLALQKSSDGFGWGVGFDADMQDDNRIELTNKRDTIPEELLLLQDESVRNISLYGFINAQIAGPLHITAGLRNDQVRFEMDDKFVTMNGDQSGNRTFSALSPAVGLSLKTSDMVLYANYRSSFETPTTTELVNQIDFQGGFDPDLEPQKVLGFEAGLRGNLAFWQTSFDLALFSLNVKDLISGLPDEEVDEFEFTNIGRSLHQGIELSFSTNPTAWLSWRLTHSSGSFKFRSSALHDNLLPGIPNSRTHIRGTVQGSSFWLQATFEHVSSFFADNDNSAKNDAFAVLDLTIGHKGIPINALNIRPFFSVRNLSDETYNGSVVVNDRRSRYFEPAPGRTFQAGVNVSYN